MTYDFIIMNPPYDGDLHLKIMENAIKLLNNNNSICVNLSPCGLVQKFYTLGKNKIKDFNIIGNEYSVDIKRFPIESAMELFNLDSLGQDLGIWYVRKGSTDINALSKSLVPNVDIVDKIKNVMVNYESLKSKQVKYKDINGYPLKFVYGLTLANHGGFGKSCYAPTSINYDTAKTPITGNHTVYKCLNTEEQRRNAHQLYTLILMRFYYKSVGMNDTPYEVVADFDTVENPRTHKIGYESDWTNEDLCKVFGITGFISDTEAEPGSEWETILETMKPYL